LSASSDDIYLTLSVDMKELSKSTMDNANVVSELYEFISQKIFN